MLRKSALIFGIVLLAIGLLGFLPPLTPDNKLLGIFEVDTVHNLIHIVTGLAAILLSSSVRGARTFFQVFAIVYGLVTIAGFGGLVDDGKLLGLFHINTADNFLHLAITLFSGYMGFVYKEDELSTRV